MGKEIGKGIFDRETCELPCEKGEPKNQKSDILTCSGRAGMLRADDNCCGSKFYVFLKHVAIISDHHSRTAQPFDQVKGIVHFGRMLDKIRLAAAVENCRKAGRSCRRRGRENQFLIPAAARSCTLITPRSKLKPAKAAAMNPCWNGASPMDVSPVRMRLKCGMHS